jgi:hypothetical protein
MELRAECALPASTFQGSARVCSLSSHETALKEMSFLNELSCLFLYAAAAQGDGAGPKWSLLPNYTHLTMNLPCLPPGILTFNLVLVPSSCLGHAVVLLRHYTGTRSWVRFPMRSLEFFQFTYHSGHSMALGSTPFVRNEYSESSWGVKDDRRLRLTILLPYVSRYSGKCGSLRVSEPYGSPRPNAMGHRFESHWGHVCDVIQNLEDTWRKGEVLTNYMELSSWKRFSY